MLSGTRFSVGPAAYARVARGLLYALIALLPAFFLPVSLDPLEPNKQTLLVVLTFASLLSWIGSMIVGRTLTFRRGWVNVFPLLVLVSAGISAFFSKAPYLSWVGEGGQEYLSVLSVLAYVALFYLVVNLLNTSASQRVAFFLLLAGAAVAGVYGLVPMLGLPGLHLNGTLLENTVGGVSPFVLFLTVMAAFSTSLLLAHQETDALLYRGWRRGIEHGLLAIVYACALVALVAFDDVRLWAASLAGLCALFAFVFVRARDFSPTNRFLLPFFLIAVPLPFLFGAPSPFVSTTLTETRLSAPVSWQIAEDVLHESRTAFTFGIGGGTYRLAYELHEPAAINQTPQWNDVFDRAGSFALTLLPAFGLFGALVWGLFLLAVLVRAMATVMRAQERARWLPVFVATPALAALVVGLAFVGANITLLFLLYLLAGIAAAHATEASSSPPFRPAGRILFGVVFAVFATAIVTLVFIAIEREVAEAAFLDAARLNAAHAPVKQVLGSLDRAASIDRFDDVYYRNLSQAFLLQAGQEIDKASAGPAMSADQRTYIEALTGASVNASAQATALSPNDPLDWLSRGSVYREFIPLIRNAGDFAVTAYEKAVLLEPENPAAEVELGKTYFALAENERAQTADKDPKVAAAAKAEVDADLKKAEDAFDKAVELKADDSPAHYQLGLVYERQGKIDAAVGKLESVQKYNPLDVGVLFQLGLLYLRRGDAGDTDRAQAAFEAAVELSPSYANARWFLASIYEQKHDLPKAIEQVEKVLEENPGNQLVQARLDRLKAGKTSDAPASPLPGAPLTPASS
jgi:tetratricopeptide (TPR) repeat protein